EAALASVWAEVLRIGQIGIHDNFFELGGDSIQLIKVVSRANRLGLRVTAREMFAYQTIADVALALVDGENCAVDEVIEQGAIEGDVPLTPIQHWFFEMSPPNPDHFGLAAVLEFRESVSADLMERAINILLSHHDALRLRFVSESGG